jgi:hypothetical protein
MCYFLKIELNGTTGFVRSHKKRIKELQIYRQIENWPINIKVPLLTKNGF